MRVAEALRQGAAVLGEARSDVPVLEARWLLRKAIGKPSLWLYLNQTAILEPTGESAFRDLVDRRLQREPLAYVLGECEFYGRSFVVDERVLVPRPETELLVEKALAFAKARAVAGSPLRRIVDVGTGSGVIAISLAFALVRASVVAIDVSPEALLVAAENCARHHVACSVELVEGELLAPIDGTTDLIVANLPYIPTARLASLQPEVRREPTIALDGGVDGLGLYRRFFDQAPPRLAQQGAIFAEIGHEHGDAVRSLAVAAFPHRTVEILPDFAGSDRFVAVTPVGPE